MKFRQLSKSDLFVSEVGFGCMSLGRDDSYNIRLLSAAVDAGFNFFDTADLYDKGMNEIIVGKALEQKRESLILATKVGNRWKEDGSGWDWCPGKQYILEAVEGSLRRLRTDYIDLYQLHGGTLEDPIDEILEAFDLLVQQGKIRYYGISSIRPNVIRVYAARAPIVSVMMQYSLLDRRPEEECLGLLKNRQIGVLARGGLAKGLLISKEPAEYLGHTPADVKTAAQLIRSLSGNDRSPAQTALQFVLSEPAVSSAVTGIRTLEQLADLTATSDTPRLLSDELRLLRDGVAAQAYALHR